MKKKRHAAILELVARYEIDTQEELQRRLLQEGIVATQATLSRDIKELRLIKVLSETGRYRYTSGNPTHSENHDIRGKYRSVFLECVREIDYAGNTVVLKCYVGMGMAACAALDSMQWPSIVGTIAGDDTVFILMRSEQSAIEITKELKALFRKK